jgi:hypothetical protein
VHLLEAASQAGGQVRLLAANPRRREMSGIVDWRLAELDRLGVTLRYDTYAEAEDVQALAPDVVVIATGGLPQAPPLEAGEDLVTTSWDILSGEARPSGRVLVYDDHGGHAGLSAAEVLAGKVDLEIVTPERMFAPEIGGLNHVPYMAAFHRAGARITTQRRLQAVRRAGNRLVAVLGSDFAPGATEEHEVDMVVAEHGTAPLDELYVALKPLSRNLGAVDYGALVRQQDPFTLRNPDGDFLLYRIGDAVTSRNIHAGIYDALRYGLLW